MEGNILQDGTFDKKASQRILRLYTVKPDKGGQSFLGQWSMAASKTESRQVLRRGRADVSSGPAG